MPFVWAWVRIKMNDCLASCWSKNSFFFVYENQIDQDTTGSCCFGVTQCLVLWIYCSTPVEYGRTGRVWVPDGKTNKCRENGYCRSCSCACWNGCLLMCFYCSLSLIAVMFSGRSFTIICGMNEYIEVFV